MKLAIYNKQLNQDDESFVYEFLNLLSGKKIKYFLYRPLANSLKHRLNLEFDKSICFETPQELRELDPDFFIALGGDGTILDSVTLVRNSSLPVLGINLGRLGFLSNVEKSEVEPAVDSLLSNSYSIEKRTLLQLESSKSLFGEVNFALNDCTILKRDTSSMVIIHAYINGEFLNSYWADGLIISTPTGSTGYSLSCGGPIVFPNSGNFVITPVAPHNLNVRPIVISDDSIISFEIEGRTRNFLCTLDSRHETIDTLDQIAIRKADFHLHLVRLSERNFLETIREKLNWGIDVRN